MAYPETFAAYYNARVRAMKSTLFAPSRLGDLLERGGLEELIEVLLNSPYEHEMAEALATHKGADAVEDAVSRSLVTSLRKLLRLADESFKRPAALFLLRWDLAAVKSLLRVRHLELTAEEGASALCPGPTLTVPLLRNLAGRESMPDVVAGLVAWNPELCACLPPELPAYRRIHSVAVFEEALDRRYFVETVEALRTPGQHAEVAAEDAWLLGRARGLFTLAGPACRNCTRFAEHVRRPGPMPHRWPPRRFGCCLHPAAVTCGDSWHCCASGQRCVANQTATGAVYSHVCE